MKKLEVKAIEVIKEIEYLNIASITTDGMPWCTAVYTSYDKDLNFYWVSWKENQHSLNMASNPNAFVTIYDSTVPCSTGFGVYFQGKVKMITDPILLANGLANYNLRSAQSVDIKAFSIASPLRLYMFTPEKAWVNGDSKINGSIIDKRTELDLAQVKSMLS